MGLLAGKVALITGAAKGIGAADAALFAAEGATVIVADRAHDAGGQLAASLANATYLPLDVTDEADWQRTMAEIGRRHGRLDILVNNAGIFRPSAIADTSAAAFTEVFRVNQLGVFLGMRAALPFMQVAGGSIVNMSSTAGMTGSLNTIAYTGTKWAVRGMTKVAALEFAPFNIRVNSVHPGLIETDMTVDTMGGAGMVARAAAMPLGRVGHAGEVARLVLFLASDASSFCTGGEYTVDGGSSAGRRPAHGPAVEAKGSGK